MRVARAGLHRAGNDRNPDAPDRRRRARGDFRTTHQGRRHALRLCPCWSICSVRSSAWPWASQWAASNGATPNPCAKSASCWRRCASPNRRAAWAKPFGMLPLAKTVLAMRPKSREARALPGNRLEGRTRSICGASGSDLLAGRAGAADHLAAGRDQRAGDSREDNFNLGIYRMQVLNQNQTIMRWLQHRGGAQHHRRWAKQQMAPFPAAAVIGADPGTIMAAVTPVPDTLSEYQFAGLLRGAAVELADCVTQPLKVPAEAEIVIEGEVSLTETRRRPLWRPHRLLQFGRAIPGLHRHRDHHAARPDLSLHLYRAAARRTFDSRRSAERNVRSAAPPAISRDRGFLAAAGRLLLSHRGRQHEESLSRPCQARDDGVWSYLRQFMYTKWVIVVDDDIDCRNWKDVMWAISTRMDPGARHHGDREYADRLSRFRRAGIRPGLKDRAGRHQQMAARSQTRMGPRNPHERRHHPHGHRKMAPPQTARLRQTDLEVITHHSCHPGQAPAGASPGTYRATKLIISKCTGSSRLRPAITPASPRPCTPPSLSRSPQPRRHNRDRYWPSCHGCRDSPRG